MGMANGMVGTTENILASYHQRAKSLGDLMVNTHRTLTGFAADRKRMAREQGGALTDFERNLSKTVAGMLNEFHESHKQMSEKQKKTLTDFIKGLTNEVGSILSGFRKDRGRMSRELKHRLTKGVKEIEAYIENRRKEFDETHSEATEKQKKELVRFAGEIKKEVKKLLGDCRRGIADCRKDLDKASQSWRGMTITLARARKGAWAGNKVENREQTGPFARSGKEKRGPGKRKNPTQGRAEAIS